MYLDYLHRFNVQFIAIESMSIKTTSNKTVHLFLIWYYSQMRLWNGCSCQMNDVQNEAIKSHIIWNKNTKYTRSHHIVSLFDSMTRLIWLWLHQNFLRLWVWQLALPFVHTLNIEFWYQHKNMQWNVLLTAYAILCKCLGWK